MTYAYVYIRTYAICVAHSSIGAIYWTYVQGIHVRHTVYIHKACTCCAASAETTVKALKPSSLTPPTKTVDGIISNECRIFCNN